MSGAASGRIWYYELLDVLVCAAGVGCAAYAYGVLNGQTGPGTGRILGLSVTAVSCWLAISSTGGEGNRGLRLWIDRLFLSVGLSLVALYGLVYLFAIRPAPWPVVLAGCIIGLGLTSLFREWVDPARAMEPRRILFLGFDSIAAELAPVLDRQIVGVLDPDAASVSPGLPFLGDPARLREAVAAERPDCIVVSAQRSHVSPQQLLHLRSDGIAIEAGPALYERLLCRLRWGHMDPVEFLFSSVAEGNRAASAFQAIYTNLIGLGLLLVCSTLLLGVAILTAAFGGTAPVEVIPCVGFQCMPFRLLRFRTRRPGGQATTIGRALTRLHLVNLPHLINVVRGEMTLFGPPAVRQGFAETLGRIIPTYSHRFAVKPGILGWSQVHLRGLDAPPDEAVRLEYDLYYVKQESLSLDLEILIRTVFGLRPARRG